MPGTVNGFGTTVCPAGGNVGWSVGPWYSQGYSMEHYDGVECVCAAFMPLIPYKAVHIYNRTSAGMGERYQQLPIKWSQGLVLRAFLGRWVWAGVCVGGLLALIALLDTMHRPLNVPMLAGGSAGVVVSLLVWWLLGWSDRRNKDIRRVMGPTEFGSSDPATWTSTTLQTIKSPQDFCGASTFAGAARKALSAEAFGQAMLAARFCIALEDPREGEALTNEILEHPAVAMGLGQVRRDPSQWPALFGKGVVAPQVQT